MAEPLETIIQIVVNSAPFRRAMREISLEVYRQIFGWKRFFHLGWWWLFLDLPLSKKKEGA